MLADGNTLPFPHVNSKSKFFWMLLGMRTAGTLVVVVPLLLCFAVVRWCCKKSSGEKED